jgi:hypothetical protein
MAANGFPLFGLVAQSFSCPKAKITCSKFPECKATICYNAK